MVEVVIDFFQMRIHLTCIHISEQLSLSMCFFILLSMFIGETRVTTPTAIETQLPWKRNEDDAEGLQQNEFPAWSNNKEYLAYNSPSATFLGNLYF